MSSTPDDAGPAQERKGVWYRDQQSVPIKGQRVITSSSAVHTLFVTTTQLSTKVAETMWKMSECGSLFQ